MSQGRASPYTFDTIFTLEERSNIFLEVMTDSSDLSDQSVFNEIQDMFRQLRTLLASKGIEYSKLKSALVPNTGHRHERAFVLDWWKATSGLYGREAIHAILPILDAHSTHSVLCGDWLDKADFGEMLTASPSASVDGEMVRCGGRGDTLYFVYLNNLSSAATSRVHDRLLDSPWYLGFLDLDLASPVKTCLSVMLVRDFIKHERLIIRGHEDDRDDSENVNLSLFDFDSFALSVRSVPTMLYGTFLSYKLERPVLKTERDTRFSLNAMTPNPVEFDDFEVVLEDRKLEYLKKEKLGSLRQAGLSSLNAGEIVEQIRARFARNYIYNLSRSTNETLKFNIILEFSGGVRKVCALKYDTLSKVLKVITFY
jgi:hypothetical protein